jgi:hypothetical protein
MYDAKCVPHHNVSAVDGPVGGTPSRKTGAASVLIHKFAGWVALVWIVVCDPEVSGRKRGAASDGGVVISK